LLAAAASLAAAGCQTYPRRVSDSDVVIEKIESGRYRPGVSPTCLIYTRKKLHQVGEDIRVTIRVIAPADDKALGPYLPIRGRFRVKRDRAVTELAAAPSSAHLAWTEIPADASRKRDRSFTQTVNKIFPMTRPGWYAVWWEGRDDLSHPVRSGTAWVRVLIRAPK
jgi:hypothetical protein